MTGFLAQLGKALADRWLALLVLPGLLYTSAATAAYHLGQTHAFDTRPLTSWLDHLTSTPAAHRNTIVILAVTGVLLTSAAAGLAAAGIGTVLQRLWSSPASRPPLNWLLQARQWRWTRRRETARRAIAAAHNPNLTGTAQARAQEAARRAQRRRLAGHLDRPQHPTRISERFHATVVRADVLYGLDLNLAWPRLWTILPETLRADISAAGDAYTATTRLAAWALLYTALTVMWWPAAILGAVIALTAVVKATTQADLLADLIDTATDLHLTDLAEHLHIGDADKPPTPDTGRAITQRLTQPTATVPTQAHPATGAITAP